MSINKTQAIQAISAILKSLDDDSPYYDQDNSPLGKRRHLELCRSGELTAYKHGRLRLVKRDEMHAYIEANPIKPLAEPSDEADAQLLEELDRLGA